jgi:DNA-binding MarR family transcriptional regulator
MNLNYEKEKNLLFLMQQVYSSLVSVSNKLQSTGDNFCTPITSRQYMTILAILHLPEDDRTIVNIASMLGATKQNMTQVINSLEKKGLVVIKQSKKDKRAVNVCITEGGMETMINCGKSSAIDFMATVFKSFSEEELKTLWDLLKKLYGFDGKEMDGFDVDANVPEVVSEDDVKKGLERFSNLRIKK